MDEHVPGGACERVGDRGGVLDRHRQRTQHAEVLGPAHPQSQVRAVEVGCGDLQHRGQGGILDQQLVAVQRVDGQTRPAGVHLRISAQSLDGLSELLQAC